MKNKQNEKSRLFRRALCVFLSLCVAFGSFAFTVNAENENEVNTIKPVGIKYHLSASSWDYKGAEETLSMYVDVEKLKNILLEGISSAQVMIDLTEFFLPVTISKALTTYVFYGMPEAFNVYEVGYSYSGNELININFSFRDFADTKAEYSKCYSDMKKKADAILDGIENNPMLSDTEKALLLHDRLCVSVQYEYYGASEAAHTAYGAFVNGSAVCQGYTMAYMYLLNRVGIKNYYCASDGLYHAWNIVYIDGKPYHVDTTWDDVSWDDGERGVEGYVAHTNFLRSTNGIISTGHDKTDFDSSPTDTKYDNYYWQNSETEFQLIGNKLYYIDNVNHKLMCADDGSELADINSVWKAYGNMIWVGSFARLSSASGVLLYSLADGIYEYNVYVGENRKIYTPSMAAGFSVFGFTYRDGYIVMDINNAPAYMGIDNLYTQRVKHTIDNHKMYKITADVTDAKTEYYVGEAFDSRNVIITAHFYDGTRQLIESGISFSGFESSSAGAKTVVVQYDDFYVSYKVNVRTPVIDFSKNEITIKENEEKLLSVTTEPSDLNIKWRTDSSAVSVDNGKIKGLKKGTATVIAEITYCGKAYSAAVNVTVVCGHLKKEIHAEKPPTTSSAGYTQGIYCPDCKIYIEGHREIPAISNVFTESEYVKSDGKNVRMITGILVRELLWQAPGGYVVHADGTPAGDSEFVCTGMRLVLSDESFLDIAVYGDVNGDGRVSSADARLALRGSVGLEKYDEASAFYVAANIDRSNKLLAGDARLILRSVVNLDWIGDWI